jgi:hypothetical protein
MAREPPSIDSSHRTNSVVLAPNLLCLDHERARFAESIPGGLHLLPLILVSGGTPEMGASRK